ncbi:MULTISPECIES: hypothetical protein [Fischerella]|uniref:Uncharacterized protein n=1 Tax=Fischerella muscicola CCMEE 5323 TaxID=2019572 RepID=A0A2N6JU56_FISMU|nr:MULTISPECIES: hypothetical protein [Fischerella]PLZ06376.1 hypothetical protein CBP17_18885 [Fischerella thermalis WC114]PLZ22170.1 hypothetical protein CBP30_06420 [Fischerella thermalis WC157]PLZ24724.1 hypothetical protein CBP29_10015 [Fischerella thermalis WC341]PLZ29855.1 hypothetical protein CBP28_08980 [Fischerella thermalis WC559]PLZ31741.1 hypothetical protein CBP10_10950 [Fischerella thermalis WC558]PLZ36601.1 hypothetical protein CBP27_11950 [Fischerella thermalis WC542]PLZ4329
MLTSKGFRFLSSVIIIAFFISSGCLRNKVFAQAVDRGVYRYFETVCAPPLYDSYVSGLREAQNSSLQGLGATLALQYQTKISNCLIAIALISTENRTICNIGETYFQKASGLAASSYIAFQRNCGRY